MPHSETLLKPVSYPHCVLTQPAMQATQRGRDLASTSTSLTGQTFALIPHSSAETLALIYLLRNTPPSDLHSRLLTALSSPTLLCSPSTFPALSTAFEELGVGPTAQARKAVEDEEARHCIRCHETYFERENGIAECRVRHDVGIQVVMKEGHGRIGHYYPCCDVCLGTNERPGGTAGEERGLKAEWCVVGRHTTQKTNVRYNGTNVQECWVRRCHGATPPFMDMLGHADGGQEEDSEEDNTQL